MASRGGVSGVAAAYGFAALAHRNDVYPQACSHPRLSAREVISPPLAFSSVVYLPAPRATATIEPCSRKCEGHAMPVRINIVENAQMRSTHSAVITRCDPFLPSLAWLLASTAFLSVVSILVGSMET